jgi:predicted HD superfamily hydrolase involved in NAD metabolism
LETRPYDFNKMKKKLKKYLDEDRYEHTMGVMYTSAALAMAYETSVDSALTAGLLHDCAKCIPNKDKLKLCKKFKIPVTAFEAEHLYLLHAKMGACLAREKYGVTEPEILDAIVYHTTGRADMTDLEKIVYIADYIEPRRDKAPRLCEIRKLAFQDLDECMYEILKDTLSYLSCNPEDIDQATQVAFEFYKRRHMERQRKGEIVE